MRSRGQGLPRAVRQGDGCRRIGGDGDGVGCSGSGAPPRGFDLAHEPSVPTVSATPFSYVTSSCAQTLVSLPYTFVTPYAALEPRYHSSARRKVKRILPLQQTGHIVALALNALAVIGHAGRVESSECKSAVISFAFSTPSRFAGSLTSLPIEYIRTDGWLQSRRTIARRSSKQCSRQTDA